ncbi:MAG TPA: lactonase family protein [Stellaceae bacterium]|nr:lactonase family protein [Stellaceae bacterium]
MSPLFAYVGCRTTRKRDARGLGLGVYRVDEPSGAWTPIQLVGDLVNPSYLAVDRFGRVLYVVHGDQSDVSAFRIDAEDGTLTFLNQQSTRGLNPVHLAVDPANRFLVVANYATGSLASLPIGRDGDLEPVCDLLSLPGETGPHRTEQSFSHPHQVLLDPHETCFIVPDKGLDATFIVEFDRDRGSLWLDERRPRAARPGAGPRHAAFHPTAPILYLVNELDSTVTTCRFDAATRTLRQIELVSTQPANFLGTNNGAAIAVPPSGRFVYVSNRGHDSVAIFAVDPESHGLAAVGWVHTQGKVPRFMTLDPSGRVLFVANEASHTIVSFHVDQASGALTPTGRVLETGSPVCILFGDAGNRKEAEIS